MIPLIHYYCKRDEESGPNKPTSLCGLNTFCNKSWSWELLNVHTVNIPDKGNHAVAAQTVKES